MPSDAVLLLESLHCLREAEKGSEPYIWPVLIRIDDLTLQTDSLVDVVAPLSANARVVIQNDMRAGQTAAIPPRVGLLRARLEDNLFETHLILVVALWDADATPEAAVRAGFQAFVSELRAAFGNALTLSEIQQAEADTDEAAREAIAKAIRERVDKRVRSAIKDTLTGPQKVAVKTGLLDLDDILVSGFKGFSSALPTTFTLPLSGDTRPGAVGRHAFEIKGKLEVREVRVDRCQTQVEAVRKAQSAIDDINQQVKKLQDDLKRASPAEKPFIFEEIRQLREDDLASAQAALGRALTALSICRSRVPPGGFPEQAEQGTGNVKGL
jgi:hypothetical protein